MNEPTIDEIEDVDVEDYTEGSNMMEKARNAAVGGLAGVVALLGGAACAGNPVPQSGPDAPETQRYTEHFSGNANDYDVDISVTYRGTEPDNAEAHLGMETCEKAVVELDFEGGTRYPSRNVNQVRITDNDCDTNVDLRPAGPFGFSGEDQIYFRYGEDRKNYIQSAMLRTRVNSDAMMSLISIVRDEVHGENDER